MSNMSKVSVRVLLRGGLGNQLFCWAAGYSLSRRLNAKLVLDPRKISVGDYSNLDKRDFGLDYFGIPLNVGLPSLKVRLAPHFKMRKGFNPKSSKNRVFRESSTDFDPRFDEISERVTLDGYFQSWKYFERHQAEILQLLEENASPSENFHSQYRKLRPLRWIAVHVRQGDYLRTGDMNLVKKHYYDRALSILKDKMDFQKIVVFSDDIARARSIVGNADLYLGQGDLAGAGDALHLMSRADGFVGANSTLSWWAAFLGKAGPELKFFPRPWYRDDKFSTRDLLLPGWSSLDSF